MSSMLKTGRKIPIKLCKSVKIMGKIKTKPGKQLMFSNS